MKRFGVAVACVFGIAMAVAPPSQAVTLEDVPAPAVMPSLPAEAKPQPLALARIVASIEAGHVWATYQRTRRGLFEGCTIPTTGDTTVAWRGSGFELNKRTMTTVLAHELKSAGFVSADDPDNLFQQNRGESDLRLAGNIKDIQASICVYNHYDRTITIGGAGVRSATPRKPPVFEFDKLTGGIIFTIDWQIYSKSQDRIILDRQVISGFKLEDHAAGNLDRMVQGGIKENIRSLIASDQFRSAVLAPASLRKDPDPKQSAIALAGATSAKSTKISDAVGAVVLVLSGGGHGSGFLVSSDGYIMTAQHVVGADKYVKIRWSDGLEGVGEVIRSDKRRDVAIIKADSRGRAPLALHLAMPEPGDTVFAIGAPIDPKLQSTVTRGVASANRIMDGFSFIQSDVTVDPGNSGGPLLTEKGEVLGFTDKGLRSAEAPTGLNFFVPIRDALDFLSLEPR